MGFGSQKEFSCGQVLESGLICAATAGVAKYNGVLNTKGAPFIQRFVSNKLGQNILTALEIYTLKHGIDFAKGDTRFLNFNVRSLGVAIANAAIGTAVENVAPVDTFRVSNVALNTVIDGVVDPLIMKEKLNMKRLSATMIGNMVGNYAGNKLVELNQESKKAVVAGPQAKVIRNDGKIVSGDHPDKIDLSGPTRAERWNSTRGKSKDWGNYLDKYDITEGRLNTASIPDVDLVFVPEVPEFDVLPNGITTQKPKKPSDDQTFFNYLKEEYKDPANWSLATADQIVKIGNQMSKDSLVLGKNAQFLSEFWMKMPVIDTLAAETGCDVSYSLAKLEKTNSLKYFSSAEMLKKFATLAKRGAIGLDVINKVAEVVKAEPGEKLKTSFEKSMQFTGEVTGALAGNFLAGISIFETFGASLVVAPAIVVGTTATGGYFGVSMAKFIEEKYDSYLSKSNP